MLASGLAVSSELTPRLVLRWLFHRRQDVFCGSASSSVFFSLSECTFRSASTLVSPWRKPAEVAAFVLLTLSCCRRGR